MDASSNQLSEIKNELADVRAELRELSSAMSDLFRAIKPRADAKICRWPDVAVVLGITGANAANRPENASNIKTAMSTPMPSA